MLPLLHCSYYATTGNSLNVFTSDWWVLKTWFPSVNKTSSSRRSHHGFMLTCAANTWTRNLCSGFLLQWEKRCSEATLMETAFLLYDGSVSNYLQIILKWVMFVAHVCTAPSQLDGRWTESRLLGVSVFSCRLRDFLHTIQRRALSLTGGSKWPASVNDLASGSHNLKSNF